VPIDDENTLSIAWVFDRVPKEQEPFEQNDIPTWRGPVTDKETGRWIASHVMNQDFVAWVGQGTIADRSVEKLGLSDRGILMLRKLLLADIEAVARGEDPKGVVREADPDGFIVLPVAERTLLTEGLPLADLRKHPVFGQHLNHFIFQAGQPPEVWSAYQRAMGLNSGEHA
jgi:5,5'-dehydrodivanillate O-demethylase